MKHQTNCLAIRPSQKVCSVCNGTGFIPFTYFNAQPYGAQQCPICHAPVMAKS